MPPLAAVQCSLAGGVTLAGSLYAYYRFGPRWRYARRMRDIDGLRCGAQPRGRSVRCVLCLLPSLVFLPLNYLSFQTLQRPDCLPLE